jgi:ubiquitin-protein ligase
MRRERYVFRFYILLVKINMDMKMHLSVGLLFIPWRQLCTDHLSSISVMSMLSDPNPDSPANIEAAKQFREDYQGFCKKVRRLARKTIEG